MKNTHSLLLCACLVSSASPGLAQTIAQPDALQGDVYAFHGNKDTLVNSIRAAEQASGGKVLDIRFSNAKGVPAYHMVIVKGGQIQFFRVEELSQNLIAIDASSKPVWMLKWRGKTEVQFAKQASVSLTQAIRTAEQSKNGAPAVAAGIARSAANPDSDVQAYTVLLDVRGTVQSVSIDVSNGEVISDPSALSY
ncbi:MAG: hypothetical protein ACLPV8_25525 [Steroidobacteraceae bacterium]